MLIYISEIAKLNLVSCVQQPANPNSSKNKSIMKYILGSLCAFFLYGANFSAQTTFTNNTAITISDQAGGATNQKDKSHSALGTAFIIFTNDFCGAKQF